MTTPSYDPVVTDYKRVSGGDFDVTVSTAPGVRITIRVPAAVIGSESLTQLARHVVGRLIAPHGVTPATQIGP